MFNVSEVQLISDFFHGLCFFFLTRECTVPAQLVEVFYLCFPPNLFFFLAELDFSCGMQTLSCSIWDLVP